MSTEEIAEFLRARLSEDDRAVDSRCVTTYGRLPEGARRHRTRETS